MKRKFIGYSAALRKILLSLPQEKQEREQLALDLYNAILHGDRRKAALIARAIRRKSPCPDFDIAYARFTAHWKRKDYERAIRVYRQVGRMF